MPKLPQQCQSLLVRIAGIVWVPPAQQSVPEPGQGSGLPAGDTLFAPLREAVRRRVTFQKLPSIVPAALGDTAGCLGAGLLAWDLLDPSTTPRR